MRILTISITRFLHSFVEPYKFAVYICSANLVKVEWKNIRHLIKHGDNSSRTKEKKSIPLTNDVNVAFRCRVTYLNFLSVGIYYEMKKRGDIS